MATKSGCRLVWRLGDRFAAAVPTAAAEAIGAVEVRKRNTVVATDLQSSIWLQHGCANLAATTDLRVFCPRWMTRAKAHQEISSATMSGWQAITLTYAIAKSGGVDRACSQSRSVPTGTQKRRANSVWVKPKPVLVLRIRRVFLARSIALGVTLKSSGSVGSAFSVIGSFFTSVAPSHGYEPLSKDQVPIILADSSGCQHREQLVLHTLEHALAEVGRAPFVERIQLVGRVRPQIYLSGLKA